MRIGSRRFFEFLLLLILCICLTFICLRNIGNQRADQLYREAGRLADMPDAVGQSSAPAAVKTDAGNTPEMEVEDDAPAGIDLSPLQEVNADVVGWIEIPGLLSYPLLQGDDNARYLSHAWNGEKNAAGAVFLDCHADPGFGGFNTLIYGHRMRNETMFGCLKYYIDPGFWRENPSVYIANEDGTWRYDIYAAYEAELTAAAYRQDFLSLEEKREFIQYGLERSAIDTGIAPAPEDTIITLSTCTGSGYDTRWVVQAVRRA